MNLIRLLTCTEHRCRADKADPVWLLCLSRLTDWNNQKVNHIHTHAQSFAYLFKKLFHTRRGQVPNKKPSAFLSHISYQLSKQWRELKHRCQPGKNHLRASPFFVYQMIPKGSPSPDALFLLALQMPWTTFICTTGHKRATELQLTEK